MSPLDLFHLDCQAGLRGGERQLLLLAGELGRRGHRNTVVCRPRSRLAEAAARAGHAVLELPLRGEWDLPSAWALRRRLRAAARPLLHAHDARGAALAALAGLGLPAPRVLHRRTDFPVSALSARWKYGTADAVLAVSEAVRSSLLAAGVPEARLRVVPDAVSPAPESPRPARPGAPVLGSLAALTPEKGHPVLLRAFALLKREFPGARLRLAGEGPLRETLRALCAELGLDGSVSFEGELQADAFLRELDLFVHAPESEGLGSAVLEAMARGVPVVASRAGGLPELVRDGETGLLCEPGDAASLAGAAARALRDPAGARERARRALAGLAGHAPAAVADAVEAAYSDALEARGG